MWLYRRGCSWFTSGDNCEVNRQESRSASFYGYNIGFRMCIGGM